MPDKRHVKRQKIDLLSLSDIETCKHILRSLPTELVLLIYKEILTSFILPETWIQFIEKAENYNGIDSILAMLLTEGTLSLNTYHIKIDRFNLCSYNSANINKLIRFIINKKIELKRLDITHCYINEFGDRWIESFVRYNELKINSNQLKEVEAVVEGYEKVSEIETTMNFEENEYLIRLLKEDRLPNLNKVTITELERRFDTELIKQLIELDSLKSINILYGRPLIPFPADDLALINKLYSKKTMIDKKLHLTLIEDVMIEVRSAGTALLQLLFPTKNRYHDNERLFCSLVTSIDFPLINYDSRDDGSIYDCLPGVDMALFDGVEEIIVKCDCNNISRRLQPFDLGKSTRIRTLKVLSEQTFSQADLSNVFAQFDFGRSSSASLRNIEIMDFKLDVLTLNSIPVSTKSLHLRGVFYGKSFKLPTNLKSLQIGVIKETKPFPVISNLQSLDNLQILEINGELSVSSITTLINSLPDSITNLKLSVKVTENKLSLNKNDFNLNHLRNLDTLSLNGGFIDWNLGFVPEQVTRLSISGRQPHCFSIDFRLSLDNYAITKQQQIHNTHRSSLGVITTSFKPETNIDMRSFNFERVSTVVLKTRADPEVVKLLDVPPSLKEFDLVFANKMLVEVPKLTESLSHCGLGKKQETGFRIQELLYSDHSKSKCASVQVCKM